MRMPSARAVRRFTTSSNTVGCSIGMSPGRCRAGPYRQVAPTAQLLVLRGAVREQRAGVGELGAMRNKRQASPERRLAQRRAQVVDKRPGGRHHRVNPRGNEASEDRLDIRLGACRLLDGELSGELFGHFRRALSQPS